MSSRFTGRPDPEVKSLWVAILLIASIVTLLVTDRSCQVFAEETGRASVSHLSGSWQDVITVGGDARVVREVDREVISSNRSGGDAVGVMFPEPILYLRAATDGERLIITGGQGNSSGELLLSLMPAPPRSYGPTYGQNVWVGKWSGDGWTIYVQRSGRSYSRLSLTPSGDVRGDEVFAIPLTSQGFLGFSEQGQPMWLDDFRVLDVGGRRLLQGVRVGDVSVGQWNDVRGFAVCYRFDCTRQGDEDVFEPHLTQTATGYVATARSSSSVLVLTYEPPYPANDPNAGLVPTQPPPVTPIPVPIVPQPVPQPVPQSVFSWETAKVINSPSDLASWPETTKVTHASLNDDGVALAFDKNNGPRRWPDVFPPGWNEPLQWTLGMCVSDAGQWYCSAVVQFWNGLGRSGGPPSDFTLNWFYDANRWAPLDKHRFKEGELIGLFACAGDCRNNVRGDDSRIVVKERSNVVFLPFSSRGGEFDFSGGTVTVPPSPAVPPVGPPETPPVAPGPTIVDPTLTDSISALDRKLETILDRLTAIQADLDKANSQLPSLLGAINAARPLTATMRVLGQAVTLTGTIGPPR